VIRNACVFVVILYAYSSAFVVSTRADDWPMYRHDSRRSGISTEQLGPPLAEEWVFESTWPPSHAWGDPQAKPLERKLELPKMRFDDAFHVAAVGDRVYFGSSSDNKIYALDAGTGRILWDFYTDGPVRLAPTVWRGNVYAGSDDGKVYCLDGGDGRVIWTFTAAPSDEQVLGNGKLISLWPVRTGVLVDEGVAYFGAGVFPAEGLYLYAVNATDGRLLWKNDTYGRGGRSNVSPQGYLLASKERLFVSSGRTMPAAFSRKDGRYLFHRNFSWGRIGLFGGTYNVLAGDLLFNATEQIVVAHEDSGQLAFAEGLPATTPSKGSRRLVVAKDVIYMLTGEKLAAVERASWVAYKMRMPELKRQIDKLKGQVKSNEGLLKQLEGFQKGLNKAVGEQKILKDRLGKAVGRQTEMHKRLKEGLEAVQEQLDKAVAEQEKLQERLNEGKRWQATCKCVDSMALTQTTVFVGGDDVVMGFDAATGERTWSAKVTGRARGLAVANGRLLVSTDEGNIHCFVPGETGKGEKMPPQIAADPFPKDNLTEFYAKTADAIAEQSGIKRGYALILGGTGRLALELARRTDLMIYMVHPDANRVAAARRALTAGGVYGGKVVVTRGSIDALPYPDYFANLIVSAESFFSPMVPTAAEEVLRMLKPCGGVAYIGRPPGADARAGSRTSAEVKNWLAKLGKKLDQLGETDTKVVTDGSWVKITRGPLNGAGGWTHQYGDAGNTASSDDKLVRGPIGILWFGDPGPGQMPTRHASNAAPLAVGGRMFIQGENVIMAYDAYNGLKLWERHIPGAMRLGLKRRCSNLAANDDSLFVAIREKCYRLDPETGRTIRTYHVPPAKDKKRRNWDYVACWGGLLYGSRGKDYVFAMEIDSGKRRWDYEGKNITPATICIGGGRLFFVDRSVTGEQQEQCLKDIPKKMRVDRRGKPIKPDVRLIVALNAETGKEEWKKPQYVSDCVKVGPAGGELTVMYANNVLLLCGQPWNGHFWSQFFAGEFSRRSLIALAADDGRPLWSARAGYRSRPLIVGDEIIAEPWAYDLRTGREKLRVHPVTGAESKWQMARPGHHCGNIAGSPNALFFRSGTTAYYDLRGDYGTAHFGAQRPGCWINCIPANGLVMMPEASSGCVCPYSVHCTIVFHPRQRNRVWGMFSAAGSITPVKRLRINFGAPGDRKDSKGRLWLAYPRPRSGRLVLKLKLDEKVADGGGFFCNNADFLKIDGTEDAWIYASGCNGLERCTIPLAGKDDAPGEYTVRMHFTADEDDQPGQRVFDVTLQGQAVLKDFDAVKEAGGPNKAIVEEFNGVRAEGALEIAMRPTKGETLLCGLEIVWEKSGKVAESGPATSPQKK